MVIFRYVNVYQRLDQHSQEEHVGESMVYGILYYIYIYTGRTKVALVELPAVNTFGFFFCTPFPLRILAWSFVVPRSDFHPPKAFHLIDLKAGDN